MNRARTAAQWDNYDTYCIRSGNVCGSHWDKRYEQRTYWARGRHAEDWRDAVYQCGEVVRDFFAFRTVAE
jgi:hypothetical protein